MFMIRTAVVLGLGVLVLPTDSAGQARVFTAARSAVGWTMTFCDRNPALCAQSRQQWAVFVKKAEFGAKMAFELISDRANANHDSKPAQRPANAPRDPAVVPTARQHGAVRS